MDLSISKIRSSILEHKTPIVVAAAALTVSIYLKSDLVKRAFENLKELAESINSSQDKIDIKEEIRRAHQKIDEELAKKNELAKSQLEIDLKEISENTEKEKAEISENTEKEKAEISERTKREIQEIDEEFERKQKIRREAAKKRSEALEKEIEEKIQKARKEHEMSLKRAENAGKRAIREMQLIPTLLDKYGERMEKGCTDISHIAFQLMSDLDRLLDPRLNPMCCNHATVLLTAKNSEINDESFSTFHKIESLFRDLVEKLSDDDRLVSQILDFERAIKKAKEASEILKLNSYKDYLHVFANPFQNFFQTNFDLI
jgi:chemotaxis protein histidine kinase CheA